MRGFASHFAEAGFDMLLAAGSELSLISDAMPETARTFDMISVHAEACIAFSVGAEKRSIEDDAA